MWKQKAQRKNFFLQTINRDLSPILLNEVLNKAFEYNCPEQEIKTIIDPEAKLAYGDLALPKLITEVCSDDKCEQYQSIHTLSKFLYNSLEAERAINHFQIIRRLNSNFLRKLRKPAENAEKIEFILKIFEILATHSNGAAKMSDLCTFLTALHLGIYDHVFWDHQAARVLRILSTQPRIAFRLYRSKFSEVLATIFKDQSNAWELEDFLYYLSNVICINPAEFVKLGFFEMMHERVKDLSLFTDPTVKSNVRKFPTYTAIMKCFALLVNCKEGQEKFMEVDGVQLVFEILNTQCIPDWIHEFAALALQNGTICKVAVWRSKEFWDLPVTLVRHAHNKNNDALQLYALEALRNITCIPGMKAFVSKVCLPQIEGILCRKEANKIVKEKLIAWLKSKKYLNIKKPEEEYAEPSKPKKNCICHAEQFKKLIDGTDSY